MPLLGEVSITRFKSLCCSIVTLCHQKSYNEVFSPTRVDTWWYLNWEFFDQICHLTFWRLMSTKGSYIVEETGCFQLHFCLSIYGLFADTIRSGYCCVSLSTQNKTCLSRKYSLLLTEQKMKFSSKDFSRKYDQIRRNFIFCPVTNMTNSRCPKV